MPVNSQHPLYQDAAPIWADIRVALAGSRAVKAAGETYLPRVSAQSPAEYDAYKMRAVWFGATARTADGQTGICTRKPPSITNPDTLAGFVTNCDLRGMSLSTYAQVIIRDLVQMARCGTLIDWTADSTPYLTHYPAEDIINWNFRSIGGRTMLSMLVLHEISTEYDALTGEDPPDSYEHRMYDQWREFILEGESLDALTVTTKVHRLKFQKSNAQHSTTANAKTTLGSDAFVEISSKTISRSVSNQMPGIPFIIFTAANASPDQVAKSGLADIVDLNFAHYRASADLWNGRHMAGLPTPWAVCFTDEETKILTLGSTQAWTSDKAEAKCGMLEMTGAALKTIQEGMSDLERQMASLGARSIEAPKKDAEAVGTVELRQRAETASLVTILAQANHGLTQVMLWALWVSGTHKLPEDKENEAYLQFSLDMASSRMDAPTLTAFVAALQTGAISYETFFYNLQSGEIFSDGRTIEEEQTAIEQGSPNPPHPEPNPNDPAVIKAQAEADALQKAAKDPPPAAK